MENSKENMLFSVRVSGVKTEVSLANHDHCV